VIKPKLNQNHLKISPGTSEKCPVESPLKLANWITKLFILSTIALGASSCNQTAIVGPAPTHSTGSGLKGSTIPDPNQSTAKLTQWTAKAGLMGSQQRKITVHIANSLGESLADKTVSASSNRVADKFTHTSIKTDSHGIANFIISSTEIGESTLTFTIPSDTITLVSQPKVLFLTQDAVIDYQARYFDGYMPDSFSSAPVSTWKNIGSHTSSSYDGTLYNFSYIPTLAWTGIGSHFFPYSLNFNGLIGSNTGTSTPNYVEFSTGQNDLADVTFETWIMPSFNGTSKQRSVIFTNGDHNSGITLRYSLNTSQNALEVFTGNRTYSDIILADSPLSYLRFNEESGSIANDSSGNTQIANWSGANHQKGATGALTYDNDKGVLTAGDTLQFPGLPLNSTQLSVEAWFKTTGGGVIFGSDNQTGSSAPTQYVPIVYIGTDGKLRGEFWMGSVQPITSPQAVNDGNWHHVVLAGKTNSQSLYLDGNLINSLTGTIVDLSAIRNLIGVAYTVNWPSAASDWYSYNGYLDEVAVYPTALTASQVFSHYTSRNLNSCRGTTPLADNLWAHVTAVFNNWTRSISLYVNGVQQCSTSTSNEFVYGAYKGNRASGSTQSLRAGGTYFSPQYGSSFSGLISDLRIFGSSANSNDIKNNFNIEVDRFRSIPNGQIVQNGLILNLDPANTAQSGTAAYSNGCASTDLSWYDLSSSNRNGTLTGFTSCGSNSGWLGDGNASPYTLTLNGVNSFANGDSVRISTLATGLSQVTVNAWIHPSTLTNSYNTIFGVDTWSSGSLQFSLAGPGNAGYIEGRLIGLVHSGITFNSLQSIPQNAWSYVTLVIDNTTQFGSIYINGSLDISTRYFTSIPINLTASRIGQWASDVARSFPGKIGGFTVYNRAMSAAEIKQNCNAHQSRYGITCTP
jgi:hypothetical protein